MILNRCSFGKASRRENGAPLAWSSSSSRVFSSQQILLLVVMVGAVMIFGSRGTTEGEFFLVSIGELYMLGLSAPLRGE